MPAALSCQPRFVDVAQPGSGPFAVIEFGPRDGTGTSAFGVVREGDPTRWPWFCSSELRYATAVSAALNAVAER